MICSRSVVARLEAERIANIRRAFSLVVEAIPVGIDPIFVSLQACQIGFDLGDLLL
ncbi:Uncharacterised protein [Aquipseudomonas alcaligenes]|nr:Uncharacterised protein [Pseudomonas alcaligenes]